MPNTATVPTLPETDWLSQGEAAELLSHYGPAEPPLNFASSHFSNRTSMPRDQSWPKRGWIGRGKTMNQVPTNFESRKSLSRLESAKIFICSISEVPFTQHLQQVYFVDKNGDLESDLPSIIATVAGGEKLYAVYEEKHTNPAGDMDKAKTMLGSYKVDECNWSSGNIDVHSLKTLDNEEEEVETQDHDLVIVGKNGFDFEGSNSDSDFDIIGRDEGKLV